jgi:hypothetical protein
LANAAAPFMMTPFRVSDCRGHRKYRADVAAATRPTTPNGFKLINVAYYKI